MKKYKENRVSVLELQLEEAVRMLYLVAEGKRTTVEIAEWLALNHSDLSEDNSTLKDLLGK